MFPNAIYSTLENYITMVRTYNIQGNLIPPSESVKDLGVIIDDKLKFHDHVASVTAKANRTLAVIHKSFHFTSGNMYINLYKSLVRPTYN